MGAMTIVVIFLVVWCVLSVAGDWLLFSKAGKPGWHSLIPILNTYDEWDICWKGAFGIVFLVLVGLASRGAPAEGEEANTIMTIVCAAAGVVAAILHCLQSLKLAKSFGKGTVYGIFLFLTDRIGRMVLGLGNAEYQGKDID